MLNFPGCILYCDLVLLQQMWNQEKDHLKKFNELMVAYRVRPTVLLPFWNVAGFVLGESVLLLFDCCFAKSSNVQLICVASGFIICVCLVPQS